MTEKVKYYSKTNIYKIKSVIAFCGHVFLLAGVTSSKSSFAGISSSQALSSRISEGHHSMITADGQTTVAEQHIPKSTELIKYLGSI